MPLGPLPAYKEETYTADLNNLLTWAFDPACGLSSVQSALTSGTAVYIKVPIPYTMLVTNIVISIATAGATLTAGDQFVGLFSDAAVRLGVSADQSANWTSTGIKTIALTAPVTVPGGPGRWAHVAILSVGTTPIAPSKGNGASQDSLMNVGLASPKYRFGSGPVTQTALPTTTPTLTSVTQPYWAGLS